MSQENLVTNPETERLEALDADWLWPVVGVTGEGAHGMPDMVQADNAMWAAIQGSGRAAVNNRYVDSEPQGNDRQCLQDIYSSVGLAAFFPDTKSVSTGPLERGRYSSLITHAKAIEYGVGELDMSEEVVAAQSLTAAIEKKRYTDLTICTEALNEYLASGAEVRIRMIRNGERATRTIEEYVGGKPNKPATHDKLAKLEAFVLTKAPEATSFDDVVDPYAWSLIMSDSRGTRGWIPEGYRIHGPYVKVTAVKNKSASS
jgi:hypothetical protein